MSANRRSRRGRPPRSPPRRTCHYRPTRRRSHPRHRAGGGPPRSPRRRTVPRLNEAAPAAETEAPNMFWRAGSAAHQLYAAADRRRFSSARKVAVTAEQLAALPEPWPKMVEGLAAEVPFARYPGGVGPQRRRESGWRLRTMARNNEAASVMWCSATGDADDGPEGSLSHRRLGPADPGRATQTDPASKFSPDWRAGMATPVGPDQKGSPRPAVRLDTGYGPTPGRVRSRSEGRLVA